jgi:hypothetical protein
MSNRRIALGLGTGAGALLGAALLSGLTSPIAAADPTTDVFAIDPVSSTLTTDTLPAFGGLGTDTITTEEWANTDTTQSTSTTQVLADNVNGDTAGTGTTPGVIDTSDPTVTYTQATGGAGSEEVVTNTYTTPLFTDTSVEVTSATTSGVPTAGDVGSDATGSLAGNVGATDDTIWFAPGGTDILGYDTASQDLLTPLGDFSLADLGGSDISSLLGGSDVSSLLGGDLLAGFDPLSLLGSI